MNYLDGTQSQWDALKEKAGYQPDHELAIKRKKCYNDIHSSKKMLEGLKKVLNTGGDIVRACDGDMNGYAGACDGGGSPAKKPGDYRPWKSKVPKNTRGASRLTFRPSNMTEARRLANPEHKNKYVAGNKRKPTVLERELASAPQHGLLRGVNQIEGESLRAKGNESGSDERAHVREEVSDSSHIRISPHALQAAPHAPLSGAPAPVQVAPAPVQIAQARARAASMVEAAKSFAISSATGLPLQGPPLPGPPSASVPPAPPPWAPPTGWTRQWDPAKRCYILVHNTLRRSRPELAPPPAGWFRRWEPDMESYVLYHDETGESKLELPPPPPGWSRCWEATMGCYILVNDVSGEAKQEHESKPKKSRKLPRYDDINSLRKMPYPGETKRKDYGMLLDVVYNIPMKHHTDIPMWTRFFVEKYQQLGMTFNKDIVNEVYAEYAKQKPVLNELYTNMFQIFREVYYDKTESINQVCKMTYGIFFHTVGLLNRDIANVLQYIETEEPNNEQFLAQKHTVEKNYKKIMRDRIVKSLY